MLSVPFSDRKIKVYWVHVCVHGCDTSDCSTEFVLPRQSHWHSSDSCIHIFNHQQEKTVINEKQIAVFLIATIINKSTVLLLITIYILVKDNNQYFQNRIANMIASPSGKGEELWQNSSQWNSWRASIRNTFARIWSRKMGLCYKVQGACHHWVPSWRCFFSSCQVYQRLGCQHGIKVR